MDGLGAVLGWSCAVWGRSLAVLGAVFGRLERSWIGLGVVLAGLRRFRGGLGVVLGPSWAVLGAILGSKALIFLMFFNDF